MWPHPFQGLGSFTLLSFTPNLAPSYRDLKDPTTRQNLRTHPDRFLNSSWHCVICDILSFCMWTHVARRMILDSWLTVFVFVFFLCICLFGASGLLAILVQDCWLTDGDQTRKTPCFLPSSTSCIHDTTLKYHTNTIYTWGTEPADRYLFLASLTNSVETNGMSASL